MRKYKALLIRLIIFTVALFILAYVLFLTVVPKLFSSQIFLNSVDDIIAKRTGIIIKSENLEVKTYPALVMTVDASKISINSQKSELLKVKNASVTFDLKKLNTRNINIEYIYIDEKNFNNIIKTNKNKKTSDFTLKDFPETNVKKVEIWADRGELNSIFINIDNIKIKNTNKKTICTFEAEIISNLLKNLVQIGRKGQLYFENNKLYADNIEILVGVSQLILNGKIIDNKKKTELTLKGKGIPVSDITSSLLYFQKRQDNSKKFMENFYDYSGNMNIDLNINENGVFGECYAINLSGKSVLFNVPILFKKVPFVFNGKEFKGGAYGTLGSEKVYADFDVINMGTKNLESFGSVQSILTNKTVGKYIPYASMKGIADASVNWHIKNKKIKVNYKLHIPENSDIFYQNASMGWEEKFRRIYVETFKNDDKLKITKYEYATITNGKKTPIILGEGLFTKKDGKMTPNYITAETENDAPVAVAGSFYKYVKGGVFNGNLKYDFDQNKITGHFTIKNSRYKKYLINEAKVVATEDKVTVETNGKYDNSNFNAYILGYNDFNNKIRLFNLHLFIDEYIVQPKKKKQTTLNIDEKAIKKHADNFEIDEYTIKLNKLMYKRAILTDIFMKGSIKDDIFNFEVPNISYANGKIKAKGNYDFNKRNSKIDFSASNIDANTVADTLFNLRNQIQGTANAELKVYTENGIEKRWGSAKFSIENGYLEKLGSTEFIIKQSKLIKKPFTLQDAINVDIKDMKALASNIKGSFDINNGQISNTNITSSQKYLALLVKGTYDIEHQNADLQLFGQYNNQKISKIKIFYVPLSFLIKIFFRPEKTKEKYSKILEDIPKIKVNNENEISTFRVKLKGDINKNNVKVEMKSLF